MGFEIVPNYMQNARRVNKITAETGDVTPLPILRTESEAALSHTFHSDEIDEFFNTALNILFLLTVIQLFQMT